MLQCWSDGVTYGSGGGRGSRAHMQVSVVVVCAPMHVLARLLANVCVCESGWH